MARAKTKKSKAKKSSFSIANTHSVNTKNTILTVIGVVALVGIGFLLYKLIVTPEFTVKREVENIIGDYYENHFYPQVLKNNNLEKDQVDSGEKAEPIMSKIFEKYVDRGFPVIPFRQLLVYDDLKHKDSKATLGKYCDLDQSQIKIYPVSPYTSHDYRTEIIYSCNFEQ